MISYAEAIIAINPSAKFSCIENDGIVDWVGGTTPISMEDITAKRAELQTAYDAQEYARDRATEYPSTGDQLDMLWHAIDTGDWTAAKVKLTSFYTELKAVKDKYPKE